ncbi:hypothetical protein J6590_077979 [Homalodisca vitripennis]|nr:hypothetical protein J6590_077979 [Homalodisca vitripennis]
MLTLRVERSYEQRQAALQPSVLLHSPHRMVRVMYMTDGMWGRRQTYIEDSASLMLNNIYVFFVRLDIIYTLFCPETVFVVFSALPKKVVIQLEDKCLASGQLIAVFQLAVHIITFVDVDILHPSPTRQPPVNTSFDTSITTCQGDPVSLITSLSTRSLPSPRIGNGR